MSLWLHDLAGGAALFALFLCVVGAAEALQRRGAVEAETARKTIHLAGGLGCTLFPLATASWVTVLILASGMAAMLHLGETRGWLRALCSVKRKSKGALLFPISILILYVVSRDRLWLYLAALLVLVLADTAAALAGTRYGRVFYQTAANERKSLEGTLAFCAVGFLAVVLPLWLLSDIPPATCVLTAALMALLLAGLEAVSIGGTDNLFVPLATVFLLWKIPDKPRIEIAFQCLSLVALAHSVVLLNRRYETFQTRPLIVFILLAYAAWSLGSIDWLIPALSGFVVYNRLCSVCAPRAADPSAHRLLRPLYPALLILFGANATMTHSFWLGPFLAATTVATSLYVVERFRSDPSRNLLAGWRLAATVVLPAIVSCLLSMALHGRAVLFAAPPLVALCALSALTYRAFFRAFPERQPWRFALCAYTAVSAALYAGLQEAGAVPVLDAFTWKEVFRWH